MEYLILLIGVLIGMKLVLNCWVFSRNRGLRRDYYRNEYLKSDEWRRKRYVVLKRDNWHCVYCGAPDYSYPQKDGIPGSGGGKLFTSFLRNELIPYIDSAYRTESAVNTLIGHSLGGYYAFYNMLSSALEDKPMFNNYIAGSPFVINDNYLVDLEQKLSEKTDTLQVKLFMCSGTIGDVDSMLTVFTDIFNKRSYNGFEFKSIELKDFDHMDVMFPTWSKGLRYILTNEQ